SAIEPARKRMARPAASNHLQVDGSGTMQMPAVPASPAITHFAGARQGGPASVSQAAPSFAGATQVPSFAPIGMMHSAPARQPTIPALTSPHMPPAATYVAAAHVFVSVSQ